MQKQMTGYTYGGSGSLEGQYQVFQPIQKKDPINSLIWFCFAFYRDCPPCSTEMTDVPSNVATLRLLPVQREKGDNENPKTLASSFP